MWIKKMGFQRIGVIIDKNKDMKLSTEWVKDKKL